MGWTSHGLHSFRINLLLCGLSTDHRSFRAHPPAPAGRKVQCILLGKKKKIWKHGFIFFFMLLIFTSSIWPLGAGKSFQLLWSNQIWPFYNLIFLFILFWKMNYLFGIMLGKNMSFLDARINFLSRWALWQLSVKFLCSCFSHPWIFCSFIFFLEMHKELNYTEDYLSLSFTDLDLCNEPFHHEPLTEGNGSLYRTVKS